MSLGPGVDPAAGGVPVEDWVRAQREYPEPRESDAVQSYSTVHVVVVPFTLSGTVNSSLSGVTKITDVASRRSWTRCAWPC